MTILKPAYLADMRSLTYSVLLCHYIYREGLTDDEVHTRLASEGVVSSVYNVYRWRRALARDGCLESVNQTVSARLTRWRLSARGKQLIEEDLAQLMELETSSSPVPVKEKTNGTITNLKSFLRSIRADDPF